MARSTWRAAGDGARAVADPRRLVLAVKAAVAAGLAWYLAPFVPYADAEYSYYAPLGVLVSMYPTLARSARSGALTLMGLAIGIGLGVCGLLLVWADVVGIVAVALVVGAGVALGSIPALGPGRDWIAMAGLFTLLLGGRSIEEFSVSYLVNMAFGVVVGVAVNLLVFPPLYLQRASNRLVTLRSVVAGQLRAIAGRVADDSTSPEEVDRGMRELQEMSDAVAEEVREADDSRRANPRARGRAKFQEQNLRVLHALERAAFCTRALAESLDSERNKPGGDDPLAEVVTEAIQRVADLVEAPADDPDGPRRLDAARRATAQLRDAVDEQHARRPSTASQVLAAALYLESIIDAGAPFAESPRD